MALQKTIVQPNKVEVTYWKIDIDSIMVEYSKKIANFNVKGYLDKEARLETPAYAVSTVPFSIQFSELSENILPELYAKLKTAKPKATLFQNPVALFEDAVNI